MVQIIDAQRTDLGKEKKMKHTNIAKFALAAVITISAAACSSGSPADSTPEPEEKIVPISAFEYDTSSIPKPEITIENPTGVLKKILDDGVIIVATAPDNPPYEWVYKDGQTLTGSELYLAKYIADVLGVELRIEQMDFNAVLTSVDTGKTDLAMAGFGWKKDRDENFQLSIGYHSSTSGASCHSLLVPADKVEDYKTFEDFAGKVVAAQATSLQQMYVEDQLIPVGAQMELVSGFDQAVLNLASGKVDALATSCSVALQYADQSGGELAKSYVEFDLSVYGAYEGTVVAARKGEEDLINVMNQILTFVNDNAIYDIMYQQALDEAGMIDVN